MTKHPAFQTLATLRFLSFPRESLFTQPVGQFFPLQEQLGHCVSRVSQRPLRR